MSLKKTVMSGFRWSLGFRLLGQTLTWAITIVVIRLLNPADYGLMSIAGVFIAFLTMINEMGLGVAVVQRKDLNEKDLKAVFGFIIVLSILICCLLIIAAPMISSFYREPELKTILWVMSLTFLLSGFTIISQSLLLKNLQYKKIATVDFISAISGSVCTLILALIGMGVWALVVGIIVTRLVTMSGYQFQHPYLHKPRFAPKEISSVISFSSKIFISRSLWYFYTSAAATLIIGKLISKEAVGIYAVGLTLACLPMNKVGGIINRVALPAFSSIQDDSVQAGTHFLKAVRILSLITIPIFWGISSIAPEIIGVFLGEKWLAVVMPLQILAFTIPLRMVNNLLFPALAGLGHANINLLNEAIAATLMPLAFIVAANWGVVGVSSVWIVVFPAIFMINFMLSSKFLCLSLWKVFREMYLSIIIGIIMYLMIFGIRNVYTLNFNITINMAIFIFVGATTYFTLTFYLNRNAIREVIRLAKA